MSALSNHTLATTLSEVNDGGHGYPLDARASEIVLDMPMSASADIWALGCAVRSPEVYLFQTDPNRYSM